MKPDKKTASQLDGLIHRTPYIMVLRLMYWATWGLIVLLTLNLETGRAIADLMRHSRAGWVLDSCGSLFFLSHAHEGFLTKDPIDLIVVAWLLAFLAHVILAILLIGRLRKDVEESDIRSVDRYELFLLRNVYLFAPPSNVVSATEALRSIFGSAITQKKNFSTFSSRELLFLWKRGQHWNGMCFFGFVGYVFMPFFSEGFAGRLPFSVFIVIMVILQVNVAFEALLIIVARFLKG